MILVKVFRWPVEQADIQDILFRDHNVKCPETALVSQVINKPDPKTVFLIKETLFSYKPAVTYERTCAVSPVHRMKNAIWIYLSVLSQGNCFDQWLVHMRQVP